MYFPDMEVGREIYSSQSAVTQPGTVFARIGGGLRTHFGTIWSDVTRNYTPLIGK